MTVVDLRSPLCAGKCPGTKDIKQHFSLNMRSNVGFYIQYDKISVIKLLPRAPVPRGGPIDFSRVFERRVYRKYRISGCIFDVRTAKVSHFRVYFLVVCPEVP